MFKLENNPAIDYFEGKGRREGEEKNKFEVALKMIQKGFSIEEISDIINMPKEWIESNIKHT